MRTAYSRPREAGAANQLPDSHTYVHQYSCLMSMLSDVFEKHQMRTKTSTPSWTTSPAGDLFL